MSETQVSSTTSETQVAAVNAEQLIESHLPLAKKLAGIYHNRYGRKYELDDLEGYANLGLVWATRKYAGMKYDMRQAIDFTEFARKRIIRNIEGGQSRMSTIHLSQFRSIKRGEMAMPTFVHDTEDYRLSDALVSKEEDPAEIAAAQQDALSALVPGMEFLRSINPLWAQVYQMHMNSFGFRLISEKTGETREVCAAIYRCCLDVLRWKYASTAAA